MRHSSIPPKVVFVPQSRFFRIVYSLLYCLLSWFCDEKSSSRTTKKALFSSSGQQLRQCLAVGTSQPRLWARRDRPTRARANSSPFGNTSLFFLTPHIAHHTVLPISTPLHLHLLSPSLQQYFASSYTLQHSSVRRSADSSTQSLCSTLPQSLVGQDSVILSSQQRRGTYKLSS